MAGGHAWQGVHGSGGEGIVLGRGVCMAGAYVGGGASQMGFRGRKNGMKNA